MVTCWVYLKMWCQNQFSVWMAFSKTGSVNMPPTAQWWRKVKNLCQVTCWFAGSCLGKKKFVLFDFSSGHRLLNGEKYTVALVQLSPKITLALILPVFTVFLAHSLCSSCRLYLLTSVSITISVWSHIAVHFLENLENTAIANRQTSSDSFWSALPLFQCSPLGKRKETKLGETSKMGVG